jgi:hypothetical protein
MEAVLADIQDSLGGPLRLWHDRSWEMILTLHQLVLMDWLCWGATLAQRAERCRIVIQELEEQDLKASPLMEKLRRARLVYYLSHPTRVPVTKEWISEQMMDGTSRLVQEQVQLSAREQSAVDRFKGESDPSMQHSFVVPPGPSTPHDMYEPWDIPTKRYRREVAADYVAPAWDADGSQMSTPGASPLNPMFSTPLQAPGNPFPPTDFEARMDAAALPTGTPPAYPTQRTTGGGGTKMITVVERHPEWAAALEGLMRSGDLRAFETIARLFPGPQRENLPLLKQVQQRYCADFLVKPKMPQIEDLYLAIFSWHPLNAPSPQQAQLLTHLSPDRADMSSRDAVTSLHNWEVKFRLHKDAMLRWQPETSGAVLYNVYTNGCNCISTQSWNQALNQLAPFDRLVDLEPQLSAANQAMMHFVQRLQEQETFARYIAEAQPESNKPAAKAAPAAEKEPFGHQAHSAQAHASTGPHAEANPPMYLTDGGYDTAANQQPQYPQRELSWDPQMQAHVVFAPPNAYTTQAPAPQGPSGPERAPLPPPQCLSNRCDHCGRVHNGEGCFVRYPGHAPDWWEGPPPGNELVYATYVKNARADVDMPEERIRDFIASNGTHHKAATMVPFQAACGQRPPAGSNSTSSQVPRTQGPRQGVVNVATQQAAAAEEGEAAFGNIYNLPRYGAGFSAIAATMEQLDPAPAKSGIALATTRQQQRAAEDVARPSPAAAPSSPAAAAGLPTPPPPQMSKEEPAGLPPATTTPPTKPPAAPNRSKHAKDSSPAARRAPRGVSTTGRFSSPVPFRPGTIDPLTPPSQLPNPQRVGRPGYSATGEQLLPAGRLPGRALSPPPGLPSPRARALVDAAAALAPAWGNRFTAVVPEGPTVNLQYLLRQGPMVAEAALAGYGYVAVSIGDRLYRVPLQQCIIEVADVTSLPSHKAAPVIMPAAASSPLAATAPSPTDGSALTAQMRSASTTRRHRQARAAARSVAEPLEEANAALGARAAPAAARAPDPRVEQPGAALPTLEEAIATSRAHAAAATACSPGVARHPAAHAEAEEPAVCPPGRYPAAYAAHLLARAPTEDTAAYVPRNRLLSGNAAERIYPSVPAATAAASGGQAAKVASSARFPCPRVTPILFIPRLDPHEYLHIQEANTGRAANTWRVCIFDTGADITLVSKKFADANGLKYGGHSMAVHTADGGDTQTLGELHSPLEFCLAKGTTRECKAVAVPQVVANAGHLYDIIVSMELILQWSAYVDPKTAQLVYRPGLWTGEDTVSQASLPMMIRDRNLD